MSYTPEIQNKISTTSFNSRDAATLAASATFQGTGEDVSAYGRVGVSITSDNATDGVLTMEVSRGNVTWGGPSRTWTDTRFAQPHMWNIVEKYFRIKYVNGTTEATNLAIQVQYSVNADILLGHQLDETLLPETEAIVVRSVEVGQDPNNVFTNSVVSGVDDNNSSTTNLTSGTSLVFTGTWCDISGYTGITCLIDGTASGTVAGTLQMQFSHDGSTVHRNISVVNTDITNVPPRTLGVVAKYFRIIYTAASDLLTFDAQVMFHTEQVGLVSRLDSNLQGTEDVTNTRTVIAGQQPDGAFRNDPANGVAISTTANLIADATFTSSWIDTHGYNVIEVFVNADVVSAADGLEIEFTDDLIGQTVQQSNAFTFSDEDIFVGFKNVIVPPKLVGARIKYTNGSVGQSSFILQVDLKTNAPLTARLDQTIQGNVDVQLVRDATEFDLDAARRHISGQRSFFFFGFNGAVGASWEDIHPTGGDINWQTSAQAIEVVSTDAADTAAGAGVRSVEVHGLSATGVDQDEVIATNGVTPVAGTLSYMRVNKLHSEDCGTYGGSHQGDITCQVQGGGAVLAVMTGEEGSVDTSVQYGSGEAGNGYWSVPLGKVAYITRLQVIPDVATNKTIDIALYERENILTTSVPVAPRRVLWRQSAVDSAIAKEFKSHIKIKALTDIWFRAKASATSKIAVSLDFYLVDTDADGA